MRLRLAATLQMMKALLRQPLACDASCAKLKDRATRRKFRWSRTDSTSIQGLPKMMATQIRAAGVRTLGCYRVAWIGFAVEANYLRPGRKAPGVWTPPLNPEQEPSDKFKETRQGRMSVPPSHWKGRESTGALRLTFQALLSGGGNSYPMEFLRQLQRSLVWPQTQEPQPLQWVPAMAETSA